MGRLPTALISYFNEMCYRICANAGDRLLTAIQSSTRCEALLFFSYLTT